MTPPLFWLDPLPAEDRLVLAGAEGRHAARVRRLAVGETLDVGDGRGEVARCTVVAVTADGLELAVVVRRTVPASSPRLVVVQALAKGERAELAVELLTELGADVIVPWAAERSIVQWRGERGERALERWRVTAREAAKQARRPWIPDVTGLHTTAEVAGSPYPVLVMHESADEPLADVPLPTDGDLVLVVGPEGGVSDAELATLGGTAVRLGAEVLRTSTAGAAAVAALSLRLGRW